MVRKILLIGAALAAAFATFARADTTVPRLGDSYETFCQSIGGKGYVGLDNAFGWNFERGKKMAWFDQNKAQAILIEFTTPMSEKLLWKGLKAQTFAPDPDQ